MLSDSESELFVTQSSFSGSRSIDLSENNFESLFADADNKKAVDNFNLRTENIFTEVFTVESYEPPTKKICKCAPKEDTAQFNFSNCSIIFNISK